MIRWCTGIAMTTLAVFVALVIGNVVTQVVDRVAGTDHDEGFFGNGLVGIMFVLVVITLGAVASFGAWEVGGFVLGLKGG